MKNKRLKFKDKKGITLIALVVTIVILLILSMVVINVITGENGLFQRAKEASFKSKMSAIAEEYNMYLTEQKINNLDSNEEIKIYAGKVLKNIIQDEELDVDENNVQDIRKLLKNVGKTEEEYVIVYENKLYYVSQSKIKNNSNQTKWCQEIGIAIWEYNSQDDNTGIKVVNGNYELVNGVYLCTPQLNEGFVKENTRYVKDINGNLVVGNWINKKPDNDWYDYKNQKWANIFLESEGIESYYVWIPRYVYKIDDEKSVTGNERMDVKFVDIDNSYKDPNTDEKTDWNTLQSQGYQLPEAFTWGDDDSNKTSIPGYWMSKYQLSEFVKGDNYTVNYKTVATTSSIKIQEITTSTDKAIAKYTYAVNGNILHESNSPDDYTITGLAKGNKAVNVTALDSNGCIVGSMTKLYEVADVNPPDLTGFDKDTTFYVYWDENGIEHNEIPISQNAPEAWYDYGTRNWANIVTRNDGLESYYVWIPRYQYSLNQNTETSSVKFIKGTDTKTDEGYQIPEAFTWGDNGEKQLTGYWMAKYQLSTEESTAKIRAEVSAGGNVIRIGDITGTALTSEDGSGNSVPVSMKYEYYLNGNKVHDGTSATEKYSYTGLSLNTTYTVNIIARNASTNEYVGAITKKIKTTDVYAPDLTGFDKDTTFYVIYNDDGTEKERVSIKKNAPSNWYDYSNRKWANIVTTANGTESYFVWIPRYEYRILEDRENESLDNKRTNVNFITTDITNDNCSTGYKVPEAFTWGDNGEKQLTGYWMSKYQLSE